MPQPNDNTTKPASFAGVPESRQPVAGLQPKTGQYELSNGQTVAITPRTPVPLHNAPVHPIKRIGEIIKLFPSLTRGEILVCCVLMQQSILKPRFPGENREDDETDPLTYWGIALYTKHGDRSLTPAGVAQAVRSLLEAGIIERRHEGKGFCYRFVSEAERAKD